MKKLVALCLLIGLIWAMPKDAKFIDDGSSSNLPHRPLPSFLQGFVLVDSSGNSYSAWTKMQECLAFNPVVGGLEFVNRGYSPTGILNVHQSDASFSFWVHDYVVYDQQIPPANGGARYPNAVAATNPYISTPTLDAGPAFGYMVAQYDEGGWWSGFWADPVDIGPGNIGCHKNIGKELPDGNILFIGCGLANEIYYRTMSPDLSTTVASGLLATNEYWGFDINGGIASVFYYNTGTLDVYYQTTTDGVTWSGEQTYDIVWPTPYTNSGLYWTQMALTDAGNPILEFDIVDNDDATYPWDGIVYVSIAESQPCVAVSPTDTTAFWGTIATGGDLVVVMYQLPYNALEDSFACHDQWFNWSGDNGATWHTPQNLTASFNHATGFGQLAKRVNATDGKFYYFFGVNMLGDWDLFYGVAYGTHGAEPHAWYVGWEYTGIEEHEETEKPNRLTMNVTTPASRNARISYTLTNAGEISLKVYDRTGSLVRTIETGYKDVGVYNFNLDVSELANGTYFLFLKTEEANVQKSLIVIH